MRLSMMILLFVLSYLISAVKGFQLAKTTHYVPLLYGSPKGSAAENGIEDEDEDEDEDELSLESFQHAKEKIQGTKEDDGFDGYALRDVILAKWGKCYDVDFNRVDSFGFRKLYLNVLPFSLGRRPFRHAHELDYLCHLQAVVEILQKYNQLDYILYQIDETNKKPLAGRSPIVAVPLRLDLTPEQVNDILQY